MEAVLQYLTKVDPEAARRARARYGCFDQFGAEPQAYGYATEFGLTPDCEREAVNQLVELQRRRAELAARDGRVARDEFFSAEQNARLVRNAEQYYRTMFREAHESWNVRDRHMVDSLAEIMQFLDARGNGSRVGDAADRAGDRRHLSAANGAQEPLLPLSTAGPVRFRAAPRRDARAGAARAHDGLGGRRSGRDVPIRAVTAGWQ